MLNEPSSEHIQHQHPQPFHLQHGRVEAVVRAEGGWRNGAWAGGETGENTDKEARMGRSRKTTWETAQQEGRHCRNEAPSIQKAQASRKASERVILSNGITERAAPHSFAKYNYQVLATFPGGTIMPFLWSRPSADVIDLTLQTVDTSNVLSYHAISAS